MSHSIGDWPLCVSGRSPHTARIRRHSGHCEAACTDLAKRIRRVGKKNRWHKRRGELLYSVEPMADPLNASVFVTMNAA